ncbi:MAG: PPOX class F420-dependent oxidoreductase [Anaerolineales bacterium]|nr:PPOX class F420-dependent oxidoreductase [Anaerolineales bacterium]
METIPPEAQDLLSDEKKAFAVLATLMEDGSPQATPIWFDTDDGLIRINTARGRVKDENLHTRPRVSLCIMDPDDPYRYMMVRGVVVGEAEEGARDHIDRLAWKYRGEEEYSSYKGETRVIYKVRPESAFYKP